MNIEIDISNKYHKGKIYINHYSKLSVIAKYNRTTIEDYIRNYIKDYSDCYLEIIMFFEGEGVDEIINEIHDEIDKLTEDVVEYIED